MIPTAQPLDWQEACFLLPLPSPWGGEGGLSSHSDQIHPPGHCALHTEAPGIRWVGWASHLSRGTCWGANVAHSWASPLAPGRLGQGMERQPEGGGKMSWWKVSSYFRLSKASAVG